MSWKGVGSVIQIDKKKRRKSPTIHLKIKGLNVYFIKFLFLLHFSTKHLKKGNKAIIFAIVSTVWKPRQINELKHSRSRLKNQR